jgi:hypothetical protein
VAGGDPLLIRRVRLDVAAGQVSADARSRRRRTLHPDQRALPINELGAADAVYGYSFIVTNLDVSTGEQAAAVEHWYWHRTSIENVFRDAKLGAALRHLPSGYPQVNTAWMWGALLAASITGWLHQLTATRSGARLFGHRIRGGQAMIATLRHAADPGTGPADPSRRRAHPAPTTRTRPAQRGPRPHPRPTRTVLTRPSGPDATGDPPPEATLGPSACTQPENTGRTISTTGPKIDSPPYSRIRVSHLSALCLVGADSGVFDAVRIAAHPFTTCPSAYPHCS